MPLGWLQADRAVAVSSPDRLSHRCTPICPNPTCAFEVEHLNAVLSMRISEAFPPGPKPHELEAGSAALESTPLGARIDALAASDLSVDEWDLLFDAVRDRLRVGERPAAQSRAQAHDPLGRIQASVLECVEALDQLHALLRQRRLRHREPERDGFGA
jgi:hypothetical protein